MSAVLEPVETDVQLRTLPRWKAAAALACALLLSLLFLASGAWKLSDLDATSERMVQSLVPAALSLPASIAVAVCETCTGILLLIPRCRRWGAWLAALMLAAFMIYIGVLYNRLLGEDCNCFPWVRRVVGPVFFAGDGVMLLLAAIAGRWSARSHGWRRAGLILAGVCALAAGAYAVSSIRRAAAGAPETALVDGKPLRLRAGRILLYFFDPECSHCYTVAHEMAARNWGGTRIVVLATREQQYTAGFLADTGLRAGISPDAGMLRKTFPFTDPPYAVALHRGRAVAQFNSGQMEGEGYYDALRSLGFVK